MEAKTAEVQLKEALEKIEELNNKIELGNGINKEDFQVKLEALFNNLVGLCIDQLFMCLPHGKGDGSVNDTKYNVAKRTILNHFNGYTKEKIKELLRYSSIVIDKKDHKIIFPKPILASSKRATDR